MGDGVVDIRKTLGKQVGFIFEGWERKSGGKNTDWKRGISEKRCATRPQKALLILPLLGSRSFFNCFSFFSFTVNWLFLWGLACCPNETLIFLKNEELTHFHPFHPTTFRCTVHHFLDSSTKKKVKGSTQIKHNDRRRHDHLCTFWEDILKEGRGQGDRERSSFEKHKNWPSDRGSIRRS